VWVSKGQAAVLALIAKVQGRRKCSSINQGGINKKMGERKVQNWGQAVSLHQAGEQHCHL
jgi:hypothetical protein